MKLVNLIKQAPDLGVEKFKYNLIVGPITVVHIILVILFSFFQILPLVLLNICSVILYIGCLFIIRNNGKLFVVFCATYLEIIVQSVAATICIGWHFGFPQYIIALVPFGYYMCHTLMGSRRRYFIATLMGLTAFISFIGCRVISARFGTVYQLDIPESVEVGIYIFNAVCNFGFLFMVTVIFIVEMQAATRKLQSRNAVLDRLASIDPLTGLYNRRSMQAFLNHALETGVPFCIAMCDIDDFKKVNDTYGHDFGDAVLIQIARIMEQRVSGSGYVCRWGGEEILLLVNNDLEQACQVAERIRRDVNSYSFHPRNQTIHCSITIGVAMHEPGHIIDDTITDADNNLYNGKRNGKNRVVAWENAD